MASFVRRRPGRATLGATAVLALLLALMRSGPPAFAVAGGDPYTVPVVVDTNHDPLTQNMVDPNGTFESTFTRPGIFWYHPHHHSSTNQVFTGMYESIIVTDPHEATLAHVSGGNLSEGADPVGLFELAPIDEDGGPRPLPGGEYRSGDVPNIQSAGLSCVMKALPLAGHASWRPLGNPIERQLGVW